MSHFVSVVIPTYRRPDLLARCLDAVMNQDFDPASYEVIVVDGGGSLEAKRVVERWGTEDDLHPVTREGWTILTPYSETQVSTAVQTVEQVEDITIEFPGRPTLKYLVPKGNHGPAAARNYGWKAARGSIIAFTDDDCIPWPNWLDAGVKGMGDKLAGVSGQVLVPIPNHPTDYELDVARLEKCEFVTANCFYLKEVLDQVGGFDERYLTAWKEDSDLYFTMLENRFPLGHAPTAIVLHPVRKAKPGVSLSQQKKNMFTALLYKKHPHLYLATVQAKPPIRYYGIALSMLAALGGLAFSSMIFVIISAGIWLSLTAAFCYQRLKPTSKSFLHVVEIILTSIIIPYLAIYWRLYGAIKYRVFFL